MLHRKYVLFLFQTRYVRGNCFAQGGTSPLGGRQAIFLHEGLPSADVRCPGLELAVFGRSGHWIGFRQGPLSRYLATGSSVQTCTSIYFSNLRLW